MKNNNITNTITRHLNNIIDENDTRNAAAHVLFEAWDDTQDGVLIMEALDMVVVKWAKAQYRRNGNGNVTASTFHSNAVITTKAPELPIGNGIYRGRRKDGTFTMIAYYNRIMVDIGCEYRNDIKIIDPFWIDLRTIKVAEYKNPHKELEEERRELIDEYYKLKKELNEARTENEILKGENEVLKGELDELKADAATADEPNNDDEDLDI